jgi:hypothetical protein
MTILVAVVDGAHVCMGADSMAVNGGQTPRLMQSKLMRVRLACTDGAPFSFIVGFSGPFGLALFLKHSFAWKAPPPAVLARTETDAADPLEAWLFKCLQDFIGSIKTDVAPSEPAADGPKGTRFEMLVGVPRLGRGRVFRLEASGAVVEEATHWTASGCGSYHARGALGCIDHLVAVRPALTVSARERVEAALTATAAQCMGCGAPFTFLHTDEETEP